MTLKRTVVKNVDYYKSVSKTPINGGRGRERKRRERKGREREREAGEEGEGEREREKYQIHATSVHNNPPER